jgi:hypothetical protein
LESALQPLKQKAQIVATDEGMQTERSDEQHTKADLPRLGIRQPGSKAKVERLPQCAKHRSEIVSTDEGMRID